MSDDTPLIERHKLSRVAPQQAATFVAKSPLLGSPRLLGGFWGRACTRHASLAPITLGSVNGYAITIAYRWRTCNQRAARRYGKGGRVWGPCAAVRPAHT